MIVEHNIRIRNRTDLQLAIEQARRVRNEQFLLLDHNLEAVYQKWTITHLVSNLVSGLAPNMFGSSLAYLASLVLPNRSFGSELKSKRWKKILKRALAAFVPRIIRTMSK